MLRGKWLLNNIFGLPVPPPPPGVDTNLENKPGAAPASMRERLAQHRQNPSCSSCHAVIDPLGFALENFDVIGGWRTVDEAGKAVDASGATIGGDKVEGLSGLRALLLADPEQFPRTVTEKLLAYALGRRLEYSRSARGPEDRPRRGGERLPLVGAHPGDCAESGVLDAIDARRVYTPSDSGEEIARCWCRNTRCRGEPFCEAWARRSALPFLDAMLPAFSRARLRRAAGAPVPDVLCAERDGHGVLDAER